MRLSRLFIDQPLAADRDLTLDTRGQRYVSQVLRLRRGDPLILFNGDGWDYTAEIREISRQACRVHLGERLEKEPEPRLSLHLGVGISRGGRMDWVIQKSVELGVQSICPLFTERSLVQLRGDRLKKRMDHWLGIIISACEQCGRSRPPDLLSMTSLTEWTAAQQPGLLLHHAAAQALTELPEPGPSLSLLIGPEGGLSDAERAQAQRNGFTPVRLGPRVMRAETAPLAALAAIQTLWGDFR